MDSPEIQALQKTIENWIEKNILLVQKAQEIAQKILDYGFIEPSKTMPFQILPTDISDSDGDLICKLYVFLEHPMYGFFSIELLDDNCSITCSNIYSKDHMLCTYEECHEWIDILNEEMNDFYKLSSAVDMKQTQFCELFLNELIKNYADCVSTFLDDIKNTIDANDKVAIITSGFYALAKDAKTNYDKALLIPSAWVVFKSLNNLPEQSEPIDEYIDEEATNTLFNTLNNFFRTENYFAAPVYLAQRICLQGDMKFQGLSKTENEWQSPIFTEHGEYILPAIDILEFKFS